MANRKARRAQSAQERAAQRWQRQPKAAPPEVAREQIIFALMRRLGRERITFEDIESLPESSKLNIEIDEEHRWVTVTYAAE